MSANGFSGYIQKNGHPFLKGLIVLFVGITLFLGLLHEASIAGEVSIVFVQRFKREAIDIADIYRRLKMECMTWQQPKTDESAPPSAKPQKPESAVQANVAKSH